MKVSQVAWKNVVSEPAQLLLNLTLFALGIGLSLYLILINDQVKQSFEKNMAGIDMVIGAKGSDLQMIFCSMYHIDNPTGNITIEEAKPFLKAEHPLIAQSVPLALGDNYKGYRIVGTDYEILTLYNAALGQGNLWTHSGEVTVGYAVASILNISIGDHFLSSHGLDDGEDMEHEHKMTVVGILEPSGTVLDNLILTSPYSVWDNHSDHTDHSDHAHNHDDHDHHHHHVDMNDRDYLLTHGDQELTNILIKFKNNKNFQALSLPRNIKKHTNMQAASPPMILNQFYDRMGIGFKILSWLAILISIVSSLSIFISLYNALRKRKYQLAILRVEGASRGFLFLLIIVEGLLIALIGYVVGLVLAYLGYIMTAGQVRERFQYIWDTLPWHPGVIWFALIAGLIGIIASLIPAFSAYKLDIHKTLSQE